MVLFSNLLFSVLLVWIIMFFTNEAHRRPCDLVHDVDCYLTAHG